MKAWLHFEAPILETMKNSEAAQEDADEREVLLI